MKSETVVTPAVTRVVVEQPEERSLILTFTPEEAVFLLAITGHRWISINGPYNDLNYALFRAAESFLDAHAPGGYERAISSLFSVEEKARMGVVHASMKP